MFFSRISIRIGAWYALAFFCGSILLFFLNGFLFLSSLQSKDRELLSGKLYEYSLLIERDGVLGLEKEFNNPKSPDRNIFLIRLAQLGKDTVFFSIPAAMASHNEALDMVGIEDHLRKNEVGQEWFSVAGDEFGDDLEVMSLLLPDQYVLQIGKDTEDREAFVENYTRTFFIGLFPIAALALFIGWLLSNRLLAPIRWLSNTVRSIHKGESQARVPLRNNNDELHQLGVLFNQMLDENESLIDGLKNTLDNVAHDLRTPIMRLQNAVDASMRSAGSLEVYRDALADCRENSDVIMKLLDAIMDITEAEAGTLALAEEPLLVSQLLADAIDLYGFVAEAKKIGLQLHAPEKSFVKGDRIRLLQVVSNLLDNAIKYSPEGTTVFLSAFSEKKNLIIEVKDQGQGISPQDFPKIWDRLFRGDTSRSTRGLGLGLSLVRAIVKAHGGEVEARSNPDGGMIFQVILKAYQPT
jgi:signal transduction histidine kinase